MATDLQSKASGVSLTRFWGGQRGTCVQVTTRRSHHDTGDRSKDLTRNFFDTLQLTREQALALADDLRAFGEGNEKDEFDV